jgi:hypothetical protein
MDMANTNAELIIAVIATVLSLIGVVGGIPQIIEWLRAKPHLRVNKVDFIKRKEKISDTNYAYDIFLEVENHSKWWKKAVDATFVYGECYSMGKDMVQFGTLQNQMVAPFLSAGAKVRKNLNMNQYYFDSKGSPYTVIIRLWCREGATTKYTTKFDSS